MMIVLDMSINTCHISRRVAGKGENKNLTCVITQVYTDNCAVENDQSSSASH